jgi:hypothetical protein
MRGSDPMLSVDIDSPEPRGIVVLLHQVEACNAGLLSARLGIFDRVFPELLRRLGLHLHIDVNNKHRTCLCCSLSCRQA